MPLKNTCSKLDSIGAYSYYWKMEKFDTLGFTKDKQIGVIAQEVQKVFPEVVSTDENGYLKVDYSRFSAILLAAVKGQQAVIDRQQSDLNQIRDELRTLKGAFNGLTSESSAVSYKDLLQSK